MKSASPASQLNGFIAKYSPEISKAFKSCRRKMRAQVSHGYELVYENYNALGIGYGAGQEATDVIVSIVAYPKWITLFFLYGIILDDSDELLESSGNRVRSIRLQCPEDLDRSDIIRLISQALSPYEKDLSQCPKIKTVIKSVAEKQRIRRPTQQEF